MARRTFRPGAPAPGLADRLAATIRAVPDHPRPGVVFRDITTLLADPVAFADAVEALAAPYVDARIDTVAGVESRGFILAAPVAYLLDAAFVPIRKKGRLPAATIAVPYALEYGEDVLEMHADAIGDGHRVLIVDDVLATGGTAAAAMQLVERLGGVVASLAFLIEIDGLGGATAIARADHTSLITV